MKGLKGVILNSSNLKWIVLCERDFVNCGWDIAVAFNSGKVYTYDFHFGNKVKGPSGHAKTPSDCFTEISLSKSAGKTFNKLLKNAISGDELHELSGASLQEAFAWVAENGQIMGSFLNRFQPPPSLLGW